MHNFIVHRFILVFSVLVFIGIENVYANESKKFAVHYKTFVGNTCDKDAASVQVVYDGTCRKRIDGKTMSATANKCGAGAKLTGTIFEDAKCKIVMYGQVSQNLLGAPNICQVTTSTNGNVSTLWTCYEVSASTKCVCMPLISVLIVFATVMFQ